MKRTFDRHRLMRVAFRPVAVVLVQVVFLQRRRLAESLARQGLDALAPNMVLTSVATTFHCHRDDQQQ
ncbi:hypothetical protein DNJ95_02880 [Stutzerimonas kirkiae]|nr:hypothetical protein DNJ95_02880 [Stutzerimonas kirkiae]TBV08083.1 hypothetical protein DNK08_11095 [Stutzerimonas kirkiae]TBV17539.1 hypothetical protein DNK01_01420 [Stutzerimonas kirkiae]